MPKVLLYGDSMITHLETWAKLSKNNKENKPLKNKKFKLKLISPPTDLDDKALSKSQYCAVGGSRFDTVHDRVRGIKVPDTQPDRGNQWAHITEVIKFKPDVIVISCGGNDCSRSDSRLKDHLNRQALANKRPTKCNISSLNVHPVPFMQLEESDILDEMKTVIARLRDTFPSARLIFAGILCRRGWLDVTCEMAANLNAYAENHLATLCTR